MDKKYIKCVLTEGFGLVEEFQSQPIQNCFPKVTFFKNDGAVIGTLAQPDVIYLYRSVFETWPEYSGDKNNFEDRKICSIGVYEIWVLAGFFHILDPEKKHAYANSFVVMDQPAAMKLIDAINTLV